MQRMRKFVYRLFPFICAVFALAAFDTVPNMFRMLVEIPLDTPHWAVTLPQQVGARALQTLAALILGLPVPICTLYGMSWWTVWKGKASARGWVLAASVAMVVQSIPGWFILGLSLIHSIWFPVWLIGLNGAGLAYGVAGLAAFGPRNSLANPVSPPKPVRISGDGTNRLLSGLFWVVQIGGYWFGMRLWYRWADAQDLDVAYGLHFWQLFLLALLAAIALHEAGHAVAGVALGMKLRTLVIGPFKWTLEKGRLRFRLHPAGFFSFAGAAGLVPSSPRHGRWREVSAIAAGPLVNLITGGMACVAALVAPDTSFDQHWEFLALFGTLSLVVFASNLIPTRPGAVYSDGARIYHIFKGGPLADLQRTFNLAWATQVSPIRPRDYDHQAIQRATTAFTEGYEGLILRLMESEYFFDNGLLLQATQSLAAAEAIYPQIASTFPASQYPLFTFGTAFLRRDAAAARLWRERMEANNPTREGKDYWLAESALHWIEDRPAAALQAWNKGDEIVREMPANGSKAFNRDLYDLLRREIDAHLQAGPVDSMGLLPALAS